MARFTLRAKQFYTHLFIVFASATIIISSALMWGVYFSARSDLFDSERRLNIEVLTQVRYNLLTLDAMNRNLCFMVLGSNEAQGLLYTKQPDSYQLMLLRNRLADNLRSNPFVHSVYLYNRARDIYYSTFKAFHYVDSDFLEQVRSGALRPNLKPLVRELDGDVVLTYGLGELFGAESRDVAIYLNVYLDDLIENLETFTGGQLLAFDQSGKLVNRFASQLAISETLVAAVSDALAASPGGTTFFIEALGVEQQVATALPCPQMDWTLVKLTPSRDVFARSQRLRDTIIAVNLGSLLLIALSYAFLSRRVYQPISRMVKKVSGTRAKDVSGNEFDYMIQLYDAMREELSKLKRERIDREDFLRLFGDVSGISSRTLHKQQQENPQKDEKPRAEELAKAIQTAIEERYDNPQLGAGIIADLLGVSSAHAGRVFRQYTGATIPERINHVRLEKAALWLSNSDLTVLEIATRVGYTNESYFFKLFKARYGVTPRAYADGEQNTPS